MQWSSLIETCKNLLLPPLKTRRQWVVVLVSALLFAFAMMVNPDVNDWDLNTAGVWKDGLGLYDDPARVYPPWGLILLLPFYLLRIEGAKLASVLTAAWLVKQREWPFYAFFLIIFSPFFFYTMYLVNMDMLAIVFPVLLWEASENWNHRWIGRGVSLAIMLLKPQATFLLWIYYIWENRRDLKSLLLPALIVMLVVVPISLVGSPPLILQWLDNLQHPSLQNQVWWEDNNISLSTFFSPAAAILIVAGSALGIGAIYKKNNQPWERSALAGFLLMSSMFLSPYTSRQSIPAGMSFIASPVSFLSQWIGILSLPLTGGWTLYYEPVWVFLSFIISLVVYPFFAGKRQGRIHQHESLPD